VTTKITIRKKIVVNGREYQAVEEMPENIRHAYEKAMATAASRSQSVGPTSSQVKIVFNGREYNSKDQMPPEIRQMYDVAMAAVGSDRNVEAGGGTTGVQGTFLPTPGGRENVYSSPIPIEVGAGVSASFGSRLLRPGIVILFLLLLLYFLYRTFVSG
jgi:hypothetical protein